MPNSPFDDVEDEVVRNKLLANKNAGIRIRCPNYGLFGGKIDSFAHGTKPNCAQSSDDVTLLEMDKRDDRLLMQLIRHFLIYEIGLNDCVTDDSDKDTIELMKNLQNFPNLIAFINPVYFVNLIAEQSGVTINGDSVLQTTESTFKSNFDKNEIKDSVCLTVTSSVIPIPTDGAVDALHAEDLSEIANSCAFVEDVESQAYFSMNGAKPFNFPFGQALKTGSSDNQTQRATQINGKTVDKTIDELRSDIRGNLITATAMGVSSKLYLMLMHGLALENVQQSRYALYPIIAHHLRSKDKKQAIGHISLSIIDFKTMREFRWDPSKFCDTVQSNEKVIERPNPIFFYTHFFPPILKELKLELPIYTLPKDTSACVQGCLFRKNATLIKPPPYNNSNPDITETVALKQLGLWDFSIDGFTFDLIENSCWMNTVLIVHLMIRFNMWDPKRIANVIIKLFKHDNNFTTIFRLYSIFLLKCLIQKAKGDQAEFAKMIWPQRRGGFDYLPRLLCGVFDPNTQRLCKEEVSKQTRCVCEAHHYLLPQNHPWLKQQIQQPPTRTIPKPAWPLINSIRTGAESESMYNFEHEQFEYTVM